MESKPIFNLDRQKATDDAAAVLAAFAEKFYVANANYLFTFNMEEDFAANSESEDIQSSIKQTQQNCSNLWEKLQHVITLLIFV